MKEMEVKALLNKKLLTWDEFSKYMKNKTITKELGGTVYHDEDVNWFLVSHGREVFYRIKGTFGHQIQILTCSGLDLFEAVTLAGTDPGKIMRELVERLTVVDGKNITQEILRELSVNDMADVMEVVGKQMAKFNFQGNANRT